jgi:uncharacterized membrane protein
MGSLARRWRAIALIAAAALVITVFGWQLVPDATINAALRSLFLCIPLFAPLYGLTQGDRYTYRWATLCVLPYFIVGLTEVVANPAVRAWAAAMLATALLWFIALVAFLRVSGEPNR